MCAGNPYVFGAVNSDKCPSDSTRMVDYQSCHGAAAIMGQSWFSVSISSPELPTGCIWYSGTASIAGYYFNSHPTGADASTAQLVCASGALLSCLAV